MASHGALHVFRAVDTAFEDDRAFVEGAVFIKSDTWLGQKLGYVFKKSEAGLGYYRDAFTASEKAEGELRAAGEAGPSKRTADELLAVRRLDAGCAQRR
jgi:hypothetical protein